MSNRQTRARFLLVGGLGAAWDGEGRADGKGQVDLNFRKVTLGIGHVNMTGYEMSHIGNNASGR